MKNINESNSFLLKDDETGTEKIVKISNTVHFADSGDTDMTLLQELEESPSNQLTTISYRNSTNDDDHLQLNSTNETEDLLKKPVWVSQRTISSNQNTYSDGQSLSTMSNASKHKSSYGGYIENDSNNLKFEDRSLDHFQGVNLNDSSPFISEQNYNLLKPISSKVTVPEDSQSVASYSSKRSSATISEISMQQDPPQEIVGLLNVAKPKNRSANLADWASQRSDRSQESPRFIGNISLLRSLNQMASSEDGDLNDKSVDSRMSLSYDIRSAEGSRGLRLHPDDSRSMSSSPLGLQLVNSSRRVSISNVNLETEQTAPSQSDLAFGTGNRLYDRDSSSRQNQPTHHSIPEEDEYFDNDNDDPYDPYYALIGTPLTEEKNLNDDLDEKWDRDDPFQDKRVICFIFMTLFIIVGLGMSFIMQTQEETIFVPPIQSQSSSGSSDEPDDKINPQPIIPTEPGDSYDQPLTFTPTSSPTGVPAVPIFPTSSPTDPPEENKDNDDNWFSSTPAPTKPIPRPPSPSTWSKAPTLRPGYTKSPVAYRVTPSPTSCGQDCDPSSDDDGDNNIFTLFSGSVRTGIVGRSELRSYSQGCMFNVFSDESHIFLTTIDILLDSEETYDVFIYSKLGSYVGFETSESKWDELVKGGKVKGKGPRKYAHINGEIDVPILSGQARAFYIFVKPTNGNSKEEAMISSRGEREGDIVVSNSKLTIMEGICLRAGFKYDESHEPAKFHGKMGYSQKIFPFT